MHGRSCVVVLVGTATAGRKWINYEIKKALEEGKGLVGIHVNKLLDRQLQSSTKGSNPFSGFTVDGASLTSLVKCHTPFGATSKAAYNDIATNIERWIEDAIDSSIKVNFS